MAQSAAGAVSALGPASPRVDAVHCASENGTEGALEQACKENDCCAAKQRQRAAKAQQQALM